MTYLIDWITWPCHIRTNSNYLINPGGKIWIMNCKSSCVWLSNLIQWWKDRCFCTLHSSDEKPQRLEMIIDLQARWEGWRVAEWQNVCTPQLYSSTITIILGTNHQLELTNLTLWWKSTKINNWGNLHKILRMINILSCLRLKLGKITWN